MSGKGKTKAELQAELDQAHDLIAALTDMLGAIHVAADMPLAKDNYPAEAVARGYRMSTIAAYTNPENFVFKPSYIANYVMRLHEESAKPINYEVYQQTSTPVTV